MIFKSIYRMSAGKKYQIDKIFLFQLTNILNQITKFTSFLLKNIFLKKISIWYFFPALIPDMSDPNLEPELYELVKKHQIHTCDSRCEGPAPLGSHCKK